LGQSFQIVYPFVVHSNRHKSIWGVEK